MLGDRLLEQGDLREAHRVYRTVLAAGAGGGEALHLNLALVAYRLGRHDESLDVLRKGAARIPGSATLHHRAGRLLGEMGRRPEAEQEYRRAIDLSAPGANEAAQARAALASLGGHG